MQQQRVKQYEQKGNKTEHTFNDHPLELGLL